MASALREIGFERGGDQGLHEPRIIPLAQGLDRGVGDRLMGVCRERSEQVDMRIVCRRREVRGGVHAVCRLLRSGERLYARHCIRFFPPLEGTEGEGPDRQRGIPRSKAQENRERGGGWKVIQRFQDPDSMRVDRRVQGGIETLERSLGSLKERLEGSAGRRGRVQAAG